MKVLSRWSKVPFLAVALLLLVSMSLNAAAQQEVHENDGYLGVSIERVPSKEKKDLGISNGIRITEIVKNSPASKSDLKEKDIILYFNNQKIITTSDLTKAVRVVKPGKEVRVTIFRGSKRQDINVTVGEYNVSVFIEGGNGNYFLSTMSSKGYLGVNLHEMDSDLAAYFKVKKDAGALILSVVEESAAAAAGIKSGDVIAQVEGEDVPDPGHLRTILDEFEKGDEIRVTVLRNGVKKNFQVELKGFGSGDSYLKNFITPFKRGGFNYKFDKKSFENVDEIIKEIKEKPSKSKTDVKTYWTPRKTKEITESKFEYYYGKNVI